MEETKPFTISQEIVYQAYKRVKANRGTYGIDKQSITDFEEKLNRNLCAHVSNIDLSTVLRGLLKNPP